ncbi:MAG TPA: hypothetical protein VK196_05300, partial [Magnetospirillum sp.]|nr:hypothetical protein [Magnetospirillum sp.]
LPAHGEAARQLRGRAALAVTVYSTAALDCMAAGIPSLSFDPAGVLDRMQAQIERVLPRARSHDELHHMLDRMLAERQPPQVPEGLFPSFNEPFAERVGALVRRLLQG